MIGSHAHSTSRVVVALVADTFQEARARWLFWGLFGLSTLLIAFFLFVLRIDVVGGAVSLLGIDQTSRHFYSLERVVRFAYAKVAMFLYVWKPSWPSSPQQASPLAFWNPAVLDCCFQSRSRGRLCCSGAFLATYSSSPAT